MTPARGAPADGNPPSDVVWTNSEGENFSTEQVLQLAQQHRLRRAQGTYQQQQQDTESDSASATNNNGNSEFESDYDDF